MIKRNRYCLVLLFLIVIFNIIPLIRFNFNEPNKKIIITDEDFHAKINSVKTSNPIVLSDGFAGIEWNDDISQTPSIVIDTNGTIHAVWSDFTNGPWGNDPEIMYANYSSSLGLSYATVISDGYNGDYWNSGGSYFPDIAIDNYGNIHVVWYDDTDGQWGTDEEIMYVNYTSSAGWSNATVISDLYGGSVWNNRYSRDPSIAIDNIGGIHVVWNDDTDGEWGTDTEIMYVNYTSSTGWSNACVISDLYGQIKWNNDFSENPSVAADNIGGVHVVWRDLTDGLWGTDPEIMYVNYTSDSGWSNITVISDGFGDKYWNNEWSDYPSITTDNFGGIHVAWQDDTDGEWGTDTEIMYCNYTSSNGWSNASVISDLYGGIEWNDGYSGTPSIATDNIGIVHVAWVDGTAGPWGSDGEIMYCNYTSSNGWSNATVVSDGFDGTYWDTGASGNPSIAIDNARTIHIVWQDDFALWWGPDSDIVYIFIDNIVPVISIKNPTPNQFFGIAPPNFSIEISEDRLDRIWYILNDDIKTFISKSNGTINQNVWDRIYNGTITIIFYANDTVGNLGSANVKIRKDLISPIIIINNIETNQRFGKESPSYSLSINEPNLNISWYSIYNGTHWSQEFIFTELEGKINQLLWDSLPKGNVTVRFYANDLAGNIGFEEISIIKSYKQNKFPIELIALISVIAIGSTIVLSGVIVRKKKIFTKISKKEGKIEAKELIKDKNYLQKRRLLIDDLIKRNEFKEAIKNLNQIKEIAQRYGLKYLLTNTEEKIDECKKLELETIKSIKEIIKNLGRKYIRVQVVEISKKSGIKDEKMIEDIIHEMIQKKEILAKYYSSSKTITFGLMVIPVLKPKLKRKNDVFLSYSTLDSEYFQIPKIVKSLEEYPEIGRVMFWEADSQANIVEYMEKTLRITNVFVLLCSENSFKSESVKGEWQAAYQMDKEGLLRIIPVYEVQDHIPRLLWPLPSVKYIKDDFDIFIQNLYKTILE
ncbi:MAG: TIR domain-containing protein [Promethearchaeota archaeon]